MPPAPSSPVPAVEAERIASPTVRRIVGPTILLNSGNYFDFLNPEGSEFTIDDIAHGLSQICRFAAQSRTFYSVAQHSVLVADHLPAEHAYAGLMHDAAEALIGDVSKPLKDLLPDYRIIEKRVEEAVFARFGVSQPMPVEVKAMDVVMLATEQRQIMHNREDWHYTRGRQPLDIIIPAMASQEAKALFLARFNALRPRHIFAAALSTPTPGRAAEPDTMGEVERLTRERDEARADAERAEAERDELRDVPWPKWTTDCLKIIRKHSGYDGYDDAMEGVDLPSELEETLDEAATRAETAEAEVAHLSASLAGARQAKTMALEIAYAADTEFVALRATLMKILSVADKDSLVDAERLSDIRSVVRAQIATTTKDSTDGQ